MSHGWRGRVGVWVGVALIGGPVGCVGPDKAKLPPKIGMAGTLPPPSNVPSAGTLPPTPPGGVPASTTSTSKPAPVNVASRTAASTPAPTTIPSAATNLQESIQLMNAQNGRANQMTPTFASPPPGITYATAPRPVPPVTPAAKQSVPVPTDPPSFKSPGSPMGLTNLTPSEPPIAASGSPPPPFKVPALPTPGGATAAAADEPMMPVAPLTLPATQ